MDSMGPIPVSANALEAAVLGRRDARRKRRDGWRALPTRTDRFLRDVYILAWRDEKARLKAAAAMKGGQK